MYKDQLFGRWFWRVRVGTVIFGFLAVFTTFYSTIVCEENLGQRHGRIAMTPALVAAVIFIGWRNVRRWRALTAIKAFESSTKYVDRLKKLVVFSERLSAVFIVDCLGGTALGVLAGFIANYFPSVEFWRAIGLFHIVDGITAAVLVLILFALLSWFRVFEK